MSTNNTQNPFVALFNEEAVEVQFTRNEVTTYNRLADRVELNADDARAWKAGRLSCAKIIEKKVGAKSIRFIQVDGRFGPRYWAADSTGTMVAVRPVFAGPAITGLEVIVGKDGKPLEDREGVLNGGLHKSYRTFLQEVWAGTVEAYEPKNAWERGMFLCGVAVTKGVYRLRGYNDTLEHVLHNVLMFPEQFAEVGECGVVEIAAKVALEPVALQISLGPKTLGTMGTTPLACAALIKKLTLTAMQAGQTIMLKKAKLVYVARELPGTTVTLTQVRKEREGAAPMTNSVQVTPVTPAAGQTRSRKARNAQ